MKPQDTEATAGLERAKSNMLKKPDPNASDAYAPPKLGPPASIRPPPAPPPPQSVPRQDDPDSVHAAIHPASSLSMGLPSSQSPPTEPGEVGEGSSGHETPIETAAVEVALELFETAEGDATGRQSDSEAVRAPSSARRPGNRGEFNDEKTVVSPSSPRSTKPPPLPPVGDRPSEPLTTPGRRLDQDASAARPPFPSSQGSEFIRTDENPLLSDTGDETMAGEHPPFASETEHPLPEEEEVIVVDDIAEELEEEEGAPRTEHDAASASSVPPPQSRH
jgi:hypothetical protein